jgi:hypothetical protein
MTTGMIANLLLNLLIIVLLAVTISYCWVLNRRIKLLQDSKSELAQLLKYFDESTERASESIVALQTASKKIGENIQMRIDKANFLLDDLAFMIEKGSKVANQMEAGFAVGRARNRVIAEQQPPVAEAPVIRMPATYQPEIRPEEKPASVKDKTSASLEAVLERVVGRAKPMHAVEEEPTPRRQPNLRPRSKAEQELLDMIKAGIKG